MIEVPPKLKEVLTRSKPVLAVVGSWLLWAAALLLAAIGSALLSMSPGVGWACFAFSLGANIFLLKRSQGVLHYLSRLLLFLFVSIFVGSLGRLYLRLDNTGASVLGMMLFLNLVAVNLTGRERWVRWLGALSLLVIVAVDLAFVLGPKIWMSDVVTALLVGLIAAGVSVFLILRRSIAFKLLGLLFFVLSLAVLAILLFFGTGQTEIIGEDRDLVLSKTVSHVETLLEGWNESSYEKFSSGFDPALKEQVGEDTFIEIRQAWGEFISKSDEPEVYSQSGFGKGLIYLARFSKEPNAELVFVFNESAGEWLLGGLSFTPASAEGSQ